MLCANSTQKRIMLSLRKTIKFFRKMKTLLDDDVTINLGSPKGSNPQGDRASIVLIKEEGRQLIFSKTYCAKYSGADMLQEIMDRDFDSIKNVYQLISDPEILKASYSQIKSRKGSMTPGIDFKDLNSIVVNENLFTRIGHDIRTEKYQPKPTKRVMIPKRNGKDRPLGIPTIEDRLVQQSLKLLLEAVYEKKFSKRSHGYHPNKGVHTVTKNLRLWRGILVYRGRYSRIL